MSSLRSSMPSLLRSLSTEEGARSSPRPGGWCTLLSSWWGSLFFSLSAISSDAFVYFSIIRITLCVLLTLLLLNLVQYLSSFLIWASLLSFSFTRMLRCTNCCVVAVHWLAIHSHTPTRLILMYGLPRVPGHSEVDGAVLLCGGSGSSWLRICCLHSSGPKKVGILILLYFHQAVL